MTRTNALFAVCLAAIAATPATAHPHVWVTGSTDVLFEQGRIVGLRQNWSFDEMYSAFATQGLGEAGKPIGRDVLAPLAKTNVESLAEFGYFTAAREGGKRLEFGEPKDYWLDADDKGILTLHFTLPLKVPTEAKKPFSFTSADPTYFVAFAVEKTKPATLVNAPAGCSLNAVEPPPLLAADQTKLDQAASENFSPGLDMAMRLATRIFVACP